MEHVHRAAGDLLQFALDGVGPQHVIEQRQMLIAQVLGGLDEIPKPGWVSPEFGLWKDGSQLPELS